MVLVCDPLSRSLRDPSSTVLSRLPGLWHQRDMGREGRGREGWAGPGDQQGFSGGLWRGPAGGTRDFRGAVYLPRWETQRPSPGHGTHPGGQIAFIKLCCHGTPRG